MQEDDAPLLKRLEDVPPEVERPAYDPGARGVGIAHIGVGAFHKAHQAVYTDSALGAESGDWRIRGVSLRSAGAAEALNPQNGLYTVLLRGAEGVAARVIGAIEKVVQPGDGADAVLAALADPAIRIVSLTVTEKAYGVDRAGTVDPAHPAVAADLAAPRRPAGVLGVLVEALRRRRAAGVAPFTALCCDNLPENGALLRAGVLGFAGRADPELARWIEDAVAFPSTMVDRITPASTDATYADAARLIGRVDRAAVECEPFSQWVIEDRFPSGRPGWEAGGALFARDVAPYEKMKLRMLNGAHSMLAYAGFLSGRRYVRDVMADDALAALVARHIRAAAATLAPLQGIDFSVYERELLARFANPAIAHETYQIAMDGTEKLPQRILAPALETLAAGGDVRPFAFAVACWLSYCLGEKDGDAYALRDPREAALGAAAATGGAPGDVAEAIMDAAACFPERLRMDPRWSDAVARAFGAQRAHGVRGAVAQEAAR